MAVTATYKTSAVEVKEAYIRIDRIWGSKEEGWNAWVNVYDKAGVSHATFHVSTPFVADQNPFVELYKEIENLPFIQDIVGETLQSTIHVDINKIVTTAISQTEESTSGPDVQSKKKQSKKK